MSRDRAIPTPTPDPLADEAVALFQPRTSRRLSREDGREIATRLTGFVALLMEWDRRERAQASAAAGEGCALETAPAPRPDPL